MGFFQNLNLVKNLSMDVSIFEWERWVFLLISNNLDDAELQRHKETMQRRQHSIEQRMRSALFREAIDSTQEQCNLLLYLDTEFEHRQLKNEISQWKNICKNEENARKSPAKLSLMMDWEYNEWDDERYHHVLSPKIEELKEEETETEVNISRCSFH